MQLEFRKLQGMKVKVDEKSENRVDEGKDQREDGA